jgi:pimeloyl-ACP methyl ester carboxylesterase
MFGKRLISRSRLRSLLVAAALLSVALALVPGGFALAQSIAVKGDDSSKAAKPTIVLVHGGWTDASSWKGEILVLQRDGFTVLAPPNPLRGVGEDAGYLKNFLATISGPIVLVGHSYGGFVITNAATGNPNVKALVFVDAFAPAQGEVVAQLIGSQSCLAGTAVDPTKVLNFVQDPALPAGDLDAYLKFEATSLYPGFAACFANGLSARQAAELAATQRPVPVGLLATPSGTPAWQTIPSWALIGTDDHVIAPAQLTAMATRANSHISTFDAGHLGLIQKPDAVVNVILSAVHATS